MDSCVMEPLEVAGTSGAVENFPPLENSGAKIVRSCTCDLRGVSIPAHPVQMSHSFVIAWICASYVEVFLYCIALDSVLIPWRIRYYGARVGVMIK